jgi:hypothetical protein
MAGEIQLNSITMATESSGSITAELDTIRPNTTNGSLTLQGDSSDSGVTGLTIDSSGNATFAQTISGGTIGSSVVFPAGHVIQAQSAVYSTSTSNNTGSYVDTGLTASITPTSTSSKVLVLVSQNGCYIDGGANNILGRIQLLRGASVLAVIGNEIGEGQSSTIGLTSVSGMYLDSPSTTSFTTYKTQFQGANGYFTVQISSTVSTIVLLEISG